MVSPELLKLIRANLTSASVWWWCCTDCGLSFCSDMLTRGRPEGLLCAPNCFSTYHAATIWVEQSIYPSQVALAGYFLYLGPFSVSPGGGCVSVWKPQSKSIEGLRNIHLIQLAAPFWRLVWPPAGHLRHVLLCPSLWMFVLICRCTQLTWINSYSHHTHKKKTWAEQIGSHWRFIVACSLMTLNSWLSFPDICGRFEQKQHKAKPEKPAAAAKQETSPTSAHGKHFPANSSVYLKSITA